MMVDFLRTSETHPLRIDWINDMPANGRIGMTFCPGKIQSHAMTGAWQRNLKFDMECLSRFGTTDLLCLLEPWELDYLQVPNLPAVARLCGIEYHALPIRDGYSPESSWESMWIQIRPTLLERCRSGKLVIFCKGGLGRTGLYAAILLQEMGVSPKASVEMVRNVRPGTIETARQLDYVMSYRPDVKKLRGE